MFNRYHLQAEKLHDATQPIEITDIMISPDKLNFEDRFYAGEFNGVGDTNPVERMLEHIELFAGIANKEHAKDRIEVDSSGNISIKHNKVTRLSFNEFSFYPKDRPLTLDEYKTLLTEIHAIAEKCHDNLHLILASFPIQFPDNNVYNIVIHVQCGQSPVLSQVAKSIPSYEDPIYPGTKNPSFLGSYYQPSFIKNELIFRNTDTNLDETIKHDKILSSLGSSSTLSKDSKINLLNALDKALRDDKFITPPSELLNAISYCGDQLYYTGTTNIDNLTIQLNAFIKSASLNHSYNDNVINYSAKKPDILLYPMNAGKYGKFSFDEIKEFIYNYRNNIFEHDKASKMLETLKSSLEGAGLINPAFQPSKQLLDCISALQSTLEKDPKQALNNIDCLSFHNYMNIYKSNCEKLLASNQALKTQLPDIFDNPITLPSGINVYWVQIITTINDAISVGPRQRVHNVLNLMQKSIDSFNASNPNYIDESKLLLDHIDTLIKDKTTWTPENISKLESLMGIYRKNCEYKFRNELNTRDIGKNIVLDDGTIISYNSTILCRTGSGEFLTNIDICLDHNYAIGLRNALNQIAANENPPIFTSEVITSNHTYAQPQHLLNPEGIVSQADPNKDAKPYDNYMLQMGTFDMKEYKTLPVIAFDNDTFKDPSLSSITHISANNDVVIKGPPFGPSCVLRKYQPHQLGAIPLAQATAANVDTFSNNYYISRLNIIMHACAVPDNYPQQQQLLADFLIKLASLKNDPHANAEHFYDVISEFKQKVLAIDSINPVSLIQHIGHLEHYLDTKILMPESVILLRFINPLGTGDSKLQSAIINQLKSDLDSIQNDSPLPELDKATTIPTSELANAILKFKISINLLAQTENVEKLEQCYKSIESHLFTHQRDTFNELQKQIKARPQTILQRIATIDNDINKIITDRIGYNADLQNYKNNLTSLKIELKDLESKMQGMAGLAGNDPQKITLQQEIDRNKQEQEQLQSQIDIYISTFKDQNATSEALRHEKYLLQQEYQFLEKQPTQEVERKPVPSKINPDHTDTSAFNPKELHDEIKALTMTVIQYQQSLQEITDELHGITHKINVIENVLRQNINNLTAARSQGNQAGVTKFEADIAQCKADLNTLVNRHNILEHKAHVLNTSKIPEANRHLINLQHQANQLPHNPTQIQHISTIQHPTIDRPKPPSEEPHGPGQHK